MYAIPFLIGDPLARRRFLKVISVPAGRSEVGLMPEGSVVQILMRDGSTVLRRADEFQYCPEHAYEGMLTKIREDHEQWKTAKRNRYLHKWKAYLRTGNWFESGDPELGSGSSQEPMEQ
jgi:hypothetical protein